MNTDHHATAPCTPVTPGDSEKACGAKGAALGSAVGHAIGAAADVVVNAVTDGIAAGKRIVEGMSSKPLNPETEHAFWRKEYEKRPYVTQGTSYDQYGPAFQYGWESHAGHPGRKFKEFAEELGRDWEARRGPSKLSWSHAQGAANDAWQRAENTIREDSGSAR